MTNSTYIETQNDAPRTKTQLFGDPNRGPRPRAEPTHNLYSLPPLNKKAKAKAKAKANRPLKRRARPRQMHFLHPLHGTRQTAKSKIDSSRFRRFMIKMNFTLFLLKNS